MKLFLSTLVAAMMLLQAANSAPFGYNTAEASQKTNDNELLTALQQTKLAQEQQDEQTSDEDGAIQDLVRAMMNDHDSANSVEAQKFKWGKAWKKAKKIGRTGLKAYNTYNSMQQPAAVQDDEEDEDGTIQDFVRAMMNDQDSANGVEAQKFKWGKAWKKAKKIGRTGLKAYNTYNSMQQPAAVQDDEEDEDGIIQEFARAMLDEDENPAEAQKHKHRGFGKKFKKGGKLIKKGAKTGLKAYNTYNSLTQPQPAAVQYAYEILAQMLQE